MEFSGCTILVQFRTSNLSCEAAFNFSQKIYFLDIKLFHLRWLSIFSLFMFIILLFCQEVFRRSKCSPDIH